MKTLRPFGLAHGRQAQGDSGNAGVSLIISIVFVSAFMLMIADEAQIILSRIRTDANWYGSGKAFYLSESVEEVANFYAAAHGMGADFDSEAVRAATPLDSDLAKYVDPIIALAQDIGIDCSKDTDLTKDGVQPCVDFKIVGRSDATIKLNGADYYSVPAVLSKTVGTNKVADSGTGSVEKECANVTDANDDCNWNKIELGETVGIPLYFEDASGQPQKLAVGGTDKFLLRIRTPQCDSSNTPSQCDSSTQRILLYPQQTNSGDFRDIDKDPVLIQWIISDEGGDNSMIASDAKYQEKRHFLYTLNTELTAGRINEAGNPGGGLFDFVALDETQNARNIMDNQKLSISTLLPPYQKPVLRLNLVERPRIANCATTPLTDSTYSESEYKRFVNDSNCNVPYLEYQLLTTDGNLSDTKQNLEGYAIVGDFKKRFKSNVPLPVSAGGFAMESF